MQTVSDLAQQVSKLTCSAHPPAAAAAAARAGVRTHTPTTSQTPSRVLSQASCHAQSLLSLAAVTGGLWPSCRSAWLVLGSRGVPQPSWGFFQHALLALHCPYDCIIDLLPGALLLSSWLYKLSRPDREAIELLAPGLRQPVYCRCRVFLCKKERQFTVALYGLPGFNKITTCNKDTLLPFSSVQKSCILTYLDLCNTTTLSISIRETSRRRLSTLRSAILSIRWCLLV